MQITRSEFISLPHLLFLQIAILKCWLHTSNNKIETANLFSLLCTTGPSWLVWPTLGLISMVRKRRKLEWVVMECSFFSSCTSHCGARCTFFRRTHLLSVSGKIMNEWAMGWGERGETWSDEKRNEGSMLTVQTWRLKILPSLQGWSPRRILEKRGKGEKKGWEGMEVRERRKKRGERQGERK